MEEQGSMSESSGALAPSSKRNSILRTLSSESFIEKASLLVLTAILSGLLVPLVVRSVDRAREGKEAVWRAQARLFDELSETILTYETLALDVSWYGTRDARNAEMQKRAFERYSERVVDLVAKWRSQHSRAQTLASPQIASKIDRFLTTVFRRQDTPLNSLWSTCGVKCDWQTQHDESERVLREANALIAEIGNDLGLSRSRR
jgi:hypothetical protein